MLEDTAVAPAGPLGELPERFVQQPRKVLVEVGLLARRPQRPAFGPLQRRQHHRPFQVIEARHEPAVVTENEALGVRRRVDPPVGLSDAALDQLPVGQAHVLDGQRRLLGVHGDHAWDERPLGSPSRDERQVNRFLDVDGKQRKRSRLARGVVRLVAAAEGLGVSGHGAGREMDHQRHVLAGGKRHQIRAGKKVRAGEEHRRPLAGHRRADRRCQCPPGALAFDARQRLPELVEPGRFGLSTPRPACGGTRVRGAERRRVREAGLRRGHRRQPVEDGSGAGGWRRGAGRGVQQPAQEPQG